MAKMLAVCQVVGGGKQDLILQWQFVAILPESGRYLIASLWRYVQLIDRSAERLAEPFDWFTGPSQFLQWPCRY